MKKIADESSYAKLMAEVNRARGIIGLTSVGIAESAAIRTEFENMRKALGVDHQNMMRTALLQQGTEQMQRMLGIHPSLIAEQSKQLQAARFARINAPLPDLVVNDALRDAWKPFQPLSAQIREAVRNTSIWREQISAFDPGIAAYFGPAALESVQRVLGRLNTASMLAAAEQELEAAETETLTVLSGLDEAAQNAESIQQLVLVLANSIKATDHRLGQLIFFQFLWPLMVMLTGVALAPVADHYIKKHLSESPQESTKAVKTRAAHAIGDLGQLTEYRYVNSKRLQVRDKPRANSPAIAELQFGQAVRVVEKTSDFTLIAWSGRDGSTHIRGWVFSRYLEKFE